MATKLRKIDNTFLTANEILTLLNNVGGVTYDALGGTENYFQVPNADGELVDSKLQYFTTFADLTNVGDTEMALIANIFNGVPSDYYLGNKFGYFQFWQGSGGAGPEIDVLTISAGDGSYTDQWWYADQNYANTKLITRAMTSNKFCSINIEAQATPRITFQAERFKFQGLPTSSVGLASGEIWSDAGILKIIP